MVDVASDKPRLEKLGVRPGHKISVLEVDDAGFLDELQAAGGDVSRRLRSNSDLIFYAADTARDLERIADLRAYIKPAGAIWVIRTKGADATLKDVDVINAGLSARMVDNKIASFSDTQAAMRLVIRLVDR
jgi:hypothetical protein